MINNIFIFTVDKGFHEEQISHRTKTIYVYPFFDATNCNKRTTLDATTYIHFHVGHKELVLKSTDLEISLQASYVLKESAIDEPYSFLVSGRRIFDLVKEIEGDIEFRSKIINSL